MIAASCLVSIILVVLKSVPLYAASLNNMVFPEPLTEEEEAVCFEILKKRFNHQNEIEQARNTLIEHNLRLVAHVVKGFNLEPDDDFLNIGYVGLIKAVDTFDFDRGTKLATYAIQCIKNEILMELRKRRTEPKSPLKLQPHWMEKEENKELWMLFVLMKTRFWTKSKGIC